MNRVRTIARLAALGACGVVGLAGCSGDQNAADQPSPIARTADVPADAPGLELLTISSRLPERDLARLLADLPPVMSPVSSEVEALWRAHGLRLIGVDRQRLPGLVDALGGGSVAANQWLGQTPTWAEIARGPSRPDGQTVALDVERIRLPGGTLRLLARTWVEPVPPAAEGDQPGAVVRLDIVPQHREDETSRAKADPLGIHGRAIAPQDQGQVFSRLLAKMSLIGDRAYLIVSERPGVEFAELARQEPEPELGERRPAHAAPKVGQVVRGSGRGPGEEVAAAAEQRAADGSRARPAPTNRVESAGGEWGVVKAQRSPDPGPAAEAPTTDTPRRSEPRPAIAGPVGPRVPTLGEAMLGGADAGPRAGRVIVVLVPRVPGEFALTP
jgi:hypothetical protein